MPTVRRKKGFGLAKIPIQFKPTKAQLAELDRLVLSWKKERPEVVRELLDEALKARRLKAVGKDETTADVVDAQKRAMTEVLSPLVQQVTQMNLTLDRIERRMIDEFDDLLGRLKFVVLAVRFIVIEVIVSRLLLRDYVHTVYKVFVEKVGVKTAGVESNFNKRLATFREEAESRLDDLTEESVSGLHEMAERPGVFTEITTAAEDVGADNQKAK